MDDDDKDDAGNADSVDADDADAEEDDDAEAGSVFVCKSVSVIFTSSQQICARLRLVSTREPARFEDGCFCCSCCCFE